MTILADILALLYQTENNFRTSYNYILKEYIAVPAPNRQNKFICRKYQQTKIQFKLFASISEKGLHRDQLRFLSQAVTKIEY